jgi:hypothetical protein
MISPTLVSAAGTPGSAFFSKSREPSPPPPAPGRALRSPSISFRAAAKIEQQGQEHQGRVSRAASAAIIDFGLPPVHLLHGVEDEVRQMPVRHPTPQVGGRIKGVS